jgi:hypothetical protein
MDTSRCPDCGKMLALVGYKHLCVPVARMTPEPVRRVKSVKDVKAALVINASAADRQRAYMREYMRKRRAAKAAT